MGFFDSFLSPGKGALGEANAQATAALRQGYGQADRAMRGGFNSAIRSSDAGQAAAMGLFDPYVQSGRRGSDLYADAIGVNGQDGYGRAYQTFQGDPFRAGEQEATDRALRGVFRSYNAGGMGNSGAARLGAGRVAAERYGQQVAGFRNRLAGLGQQGYGAAAQAAGLAQGGGQYRSGLQYGFGQDRANLAYGYGQQRAGNAISYGNALAQSQQSGINNLLGIGGLALKGAGMFMGLPPVAGGGGGYVGPFRSAASAGEQLPWA